MGDGELYWGECYTAAACSTGSYNLDLKKSFSISYVEVAIQAELAGYGDTVVIGAFLHDIGN